jgi:hypothetical protein
VGATPALPILAALPRGAVSWPILAIAIATVLGAGGLAGWRIRRDVGDDLAAQVRTVLTTGLVAGLAAAALVAIAGGPFGPGRLAAVGPSPWKVGLSAGGEVAVVALVVVAVHGWWRLWRALPGAARPR